MKASISGHMGGFSASLSVATNLKDLVSNRNVRITYSQTGGGTGKKPDHSSDSAPETAGGVLTMNADELLGRVRDFPIEARASDGDVGAYEVRGDVIDYGAVENRTAGCTA